MSATDRERRVENLICRFWMVYGSRSDKLLVVDCPIDPFHKECTVGNHILYKNVDWTDFAFHFSVGCGALDLVRNDDGDIRIIYIDDKSESFQHWLNGELVSNTTVAEIFGWTIHVGLFSVRLDYRNSCFRCDCLC